MKIKILFLLLSLSQSSFAANHVNCMTTAQEGYYVKKTMSVGFQSSESVFVKPYDSEAEEWNEGSAGALSRIKVDGTHVYKGFVSEDLFGDLSEGLADKGIYLYVSAEVLRGETGWVSLVARGTEVGLEQANYLCRQKQGTQKTGGSN